MLLMLGKIVVAAQLAYSKAQSRVTFAVHPREHLEGSTLLQAGNPPTGARRPSL